MNTGRKDDAAKLRWSLIPKGVMQDMVEVLEFGAAKYGDHNWVNVPHAEQRYYDAFMRHVDAWWKGEELDKESGKSHLAHAMCCITFLMWLDKHK